MTYEAWRCTYQSSEQAARAAYETVEKLAAQRDELLDALANCVAVMERELDGLKCIQPELQLARTTIANVLAQSTDQTAKG